MSAFSRHRMLWMGSALLAAAVVAGAGVRLIAQEPSDVQDDPAAANMVDPNQQDPPQRVARLSVIHGVASMQPGTSSEFTAAEVNYPMTSGDRVYAGDGSMVELQTGQLAARLGADTDLTVSAMTDTLAQFGLAGGSVHLRSYGIAPGTTVELDTPNAAITVLVPGDIRVDVDPQSDLSYVTVYTGQVQINGTDFEQTLNADASLRLEGLNPLNVVTAEFPRPDALDQFSQGRDQEYAASEQIDSQYVNDATIGAEDLGEYGDWNNDADYGAVWYPRGVAVDWEPYRVGRWAWVGPWGWTWVEAEPWGFAPFHYGRWARFGNRWGWIPGPSVVRPVWAPALVMFVGGPNFHGGLTAWFPLGPREVYTPWYRTTPRYLNRVNVSNIWSRDTRTVRAVYEQRTINPAFNPGAHGREYMHRDLAIAVPQAAFAAGRPVAPNVVRVSHDQLASAQLLGRPDVRPAHEIVAPAPARVLPPRVQRPVLDARGMGTSGRSTSGANNASGSGNEWHGRPEQSHTDASDGGPRRGFENGPPAPSQPVQGAVQQPNPARGNQNTQPPAENGWEHGEPGRQQGTTAPPQPGKPPAQLERGWDRGQPQPQTGQQPVQGHVIEPNPRRGSVLTMQPPVPSDVHPQTAPPQGWGGNREGRGNQPQPSSNNEAPRNVNRPAPQTQPQQRPQPAPQAPASHPQPTQNQQQQDGHRR